MACAKPVVATAAGGIPEVVAEGETGFIVPPRDHQAMADAIVQLLKEPALQERLGTAGRARVRDRFSADRMLRDTLRVYQRVALHPHHDDG